MQQRAERSPSGRAEKSGMSTVVIDPQCPTCKGFGTIQVDWGEDTCPSCRLKSRYMTRYCDGCSTEQPIAGMTFL
jgi:DnaJ-class molecular chaperone